MLGGLTTVIVAWACAASCNPYRRPMFFNNSVGVESWHVTRGETRGALFVKSLRVRVTGPRSTIVNGLSSPPVHQPLGAQFAPWEELSAASAEYRNGATLVDHRWFDARGWPMLALECEFRIDNKNNASNVMNGAVIPGAPPWSLPPSTAVRALPFKPMWFGFTLNTVFFSSGWWIVLAGTPPLRRWIRERRGRCPQCGYDLRGNFQTGCAECGWHKRAGIASEE